MPLDDGAVEAALACATIHHWERPEAGLAELRRVARGPVVVFTFDLDELPAWQQEYRAYGLQIERPRFPWLDAVAEGLGGRTRLERLPTPEDCLDGFFEAFWSRPEALLDPAVRACQSMWALLPAGVEERIVNRLALALEAGEWDARYGYLREQTPTTVPCGWSSPSPRRSSRPPPAAARPPTRLSAPVTPGFDARDRFPLG